MKVAIINYSHGEGSTGKNADKMFADCVSRGYETKLFYGVLPKSDCSNNPNYIYFGNHGINIIDHIISNFTGLSGSLAIIPTHKLLNELNTFKPDIIWLYNIHGGVVNEYKLLEYAKKKAKWTIYSMADEYAFLGKCCYSFECEKYKDKKGCSHCKHLHDSPRSLIFDNSSYHFRKKEKAYHNFQNIIFESAPYVVDKAKESTLLKGKLFHKTDTYIDIEGIYYPRDTKRIRQELNIPLKKRVMLLCANVNSIYKGVKYFLEAAQKCINEEIVFINVGYGGDISKCPENYIALPYIYDQNYLAELFSLADAYVCTSIVDAQPNACINALGCGTPIIGFNTSGVPYITGKQNGTYVRPFDIDELVKVIKNTPRKTEDTIKSCHEYAKMRYGFKNNKTSNILDIVEELIKGEFNIE